ncbi:SHOCT domain-containing protein [Halobaculum rubrum]|nr:SHOCT domain-containing protein [Halobaculum rubrum]
MLGLFLAFGVDTILIVAVLWYVGSIPGSTAGRISVAVLSVFLLWVAVRWNRLRRTGGTDATESAGTDTEDDPVEHLKRRYAEGEVSDDEFERRIDRLLGADSRLDAEATGTATREREPE